MDPITLRAARTADAVGIAELHAASWRVAYASILDPNYLAGPIEGDRLAVWHGRLQDPPANQIVTVAETAEGHVAGFVCSYRDEDPQWGGPALLRAAWWPRGGVPALRDSACGGQDDPSRRLADKPRTGVMVLKFAMLHIVNFRS